MEENLKPFFPRTPEEREEREKEAAVRETFYRKGVNQGTVWFYQIVRCMAEDGASGEQIRLRLRDLAEVLVDWRNARVEMPEGNPWEWIPADLEGFIGRRRSEW